MTAFSHCKGCNVVGGKDRKSYTFPVLCNHFGLLYPPRCTLCTHPWTRTSAPQTADKTMKDNSTSILPYLGKPMPLLSKQNALAGLLTQTPRQITAELHLCWLKGIFSTLRPLELMRLESNWHRFDKLPLFDSDDGKPPIALKPEALKNT